MYVSNEYPKRRSEPSFQASSLTRDYFATKANRDAKVNSNTHTAGVPHAPQIISW